MRYIVFAIVGASALSLAACASSTSPTNHSPGASGASSSPSTTANAGGGRDRVAGLIASVSGNAIQVNQQNGPATVDFTNSTKFAEISPGALTDVTAGSCVTIRTSRENQSTARAVLVSPADNGKCPQPQRNRGIVGSVSSVTGNTISVATAGNSTNVSVTADTSYARRASATSQSVAQGKCIAARGTKDNNGALQATAVTVLPANNGNCPRTKG
jgi:hypothetical protein